MKTNFKTIAEYNRGQEKSDRAICDLLQREIEKALPKAESKIWHGSPVWFLDGNPIVGYSKLKDAVNLMFWSGASFDEKELKPRAGKFKDASSRYTLVEQLNTKDLRRWLKKSIEIQWDYKNIVTRKGHLERLK